MIINNSNNNASYKTVVILASSSALRALLINIEILEETEALRETLVDVSGRSWWTKGQLKT